MTQPTQNLNQFGQLPIKGYLDSMVNPTVFSVQLDPDSVSAPLYPGDEVKIVDVAGNMIVVDKAAATDVGFAFVIYSPKKNSFEVGDMLEVAGAFSVIYCQAQAAIARGAQLEFVASGGLVKTNTGNPVCGIALDKAGAANDLIRILILNPYAIPAAITSGSIDNTAIGGSTPAAGTFTALAATVSSTLAGLITLSGVIQGATPFVFEGATADAFEGSFAVAEFTADRTVTLPDGSGTFALLSQAVLTAGATPSFAPGAGVSGYTLTPGEDETIAAVTTLAVTGKTYYLRVLTSGVTDRAITFGSNFKSTGVLQTGTSSGKYFMMAFYFDGTNFIEVSRTTAM